MITLIRTNSENKNFQELVKKLDIELAKRDGDDHAFYDQFNNIVTVKYVIVAHENEDLVGCGAIKEYSEAVMEIKRMFVPLFKRGHDIASIILNALENWSLELGYSKCILETGKMEPEAISLYEKIII